MRISDRISCRGPCRPPVAIALAVALALAPAPGCKSSPDESGPPSEVFARVESRTITRENVEDRVRGRLVELEIERHDILKEGLDELIDEVALARAAEARGMTVDALLAAEVDAKIEAPTDREIATFFEENKSQLGGKTLDDIKPSIETYLRQARAADRREGFLSGLRDTQSVTVLLKPPSVVVAAEGPARGAADAPVTIVEFSDFACPYCKRAATTLSKVIDTYADRVRIIYRHFPLQPDSERVAAAASCADEQGKFWRYHDLLFAHEGPLDDSALDHVAGTAELDAQAFAACRDSGRGAAVIARDATAAEAAGVTGTPAFFVNGRPLSGALPYEAFRDAIEQALKDVEMS